MYEYFAFIDESTAKRYRLCLVAIPSSDLKTTRTELQKLRLKGQTRIHTSKESPSRQKEIIQKILSIPSWKCLILEMNNSSIANSDARKMLFILASAHPLWSSIRHIVVEDSNESARDKSVLNWIKNQTGRKFDFEFAKASHDECLWIADALAWAYSRGGYFRKIVKARIEVIPSP